MATKNKTDDRERYGYFIQEDCVDYILETHYTPDFLEVVGKAGGDTCTYRVYGDSKKGFYICER